MSFRDSGNELAWRKVVDEAAAATASFSCPMTKVGFEQQHHCQTSHEPTTIVILMPIYVTIITTTSTDVIMTLIIINNHTHVGTTSTSITRCHAFSCSCKNHRQRHYDIRRIMAVFPSMVSNPSLRCRATNALAESTAPSVLGNWTLGCERASAFFYYNYC